MHGVTDLGRVQPRSAAALDVTAPRDGLHPDDPLGVVAVAAALEERDRAVGEARARAQAAAPGSRRARAAAAPAAGTSSPAPSKSSELTRLVRLVVDGRSHRDLAVRRRRRSGRCAARRPPRPARPRPGRTRRAGRARRRAASRSSTQPIGVRSSRSLRSVDRARDDQPLHRPRHRDVVEAQSLGLLLRGPRLLDVLVRGRADARARARMRDLEPEAAVGEAEDLVACAFARARRPRRRRP